MDCLYELLSELEGLSDEQIWYIVNFIIELKKLGVI